MFEVVCVEWMHPAITNADINRTAVHQQYGTERHQPCARRDNSLALNTFKQKLKTFLRATTNVIGRRM